eukprot:TRINITY_DN5332_c0_g1_i1.p1 TRINITY_DN5332_c0_g1~~TRINITY_DN5332_c0_g1_i1.p1  ORF type:complete len:457 (-),score=99.11 TRINITY_DN5332_c0_g1_i1:99-1469(-)
MLVWSTSILARSEISVAELLHGHATGNPLIPSASIFGSLGPSHQSPDGGCAVNIFAKLTDQPPPPVFIVWLFKTMMNLLSPSWWSRRLYPAKAFITNRLWVAWQLLRFVARLGNLRAPTNVFRFFTNLRREIVSVPPRGHPVPPDQLDPLLTESLWYLKFATGVYGYLAESAGNAFVWAFKLLFYLFTSEQTNLDLARRYIGLEEEDVLSFQFPLTDVFNPAHLVAVTNYHGEDRIVVAFRGSTTWSDWLSDFVVDNERIHELAEPAANGLPDGDAVKASANEVVVFRGMWRGAKNKWMQLNHLIQNKMNEDPSKKYKVCVTGHSLGAGVAALFAMILLKATDWDVECQCFAPPSVTEQLLAKRYARHIVSFVNRNDMVPRMCEGSLYILGQSLGITRNNESPVNMVPPGTVFHLLGTENKHNIERFSDDGSEFQVLARPFHREDFLKLFFRSFCC